MGRHGLAGRPAGERAPAQARVPLAQVLPMPQEPLGMCSVPPSAEKTESVRTCHCSYEHQQVTLAEGDLLRDALTQGPGWGTGTSGPGPVTTVTVSVTAWPSLYSCSTAQLRHWLTGNL